MKTEAEKPATDQQDLLPEGYKEVPWPQSGRFVFGPWCLFGAWPAVFGVIEEAADEMNQKKEKR